MTLTSLAEAEAPYTGKIIKKYPQCFLKEVNVCYKMVYYNLYLG